MSVFSTVGKFLRNNATAASTPFRQTGRAAARVVAPAVGETVRENMPPENPPEESTNKNVSNHGNLLSAETYTYPSDLGDNPEQPHSVIFYINARERSSVGSAAKTELAIDQASGGFGAWAQADKIRKEQVTNENRASGEQNDALETGLNLAGILAGGKIGKDLVGGIVNKVTGGDGSAALQAVGKGVGTVAGAGVGYALAQKLGDTILQANDTIRLLCAIQLMVSAPPTVSYGAKWNNSDLGTIGGAISQGLGGLGEIDENSSITDIAMNLVETAAGDVGQAAARGAIQGAANLPAMLGGGNLGDVFDVTTKTTLNPFREQLFEKMDFRSFAFNYTFAPRSQQELNNVMQIIQLFKYFMHPELAQGKTVLIYPAEFNIEYMYKDERNEYINEISTCALTNMDVSYGQGDFTTFKDNSGAPNQISMRLQFTELEMLVRGEGRITDDWRNSK